VEGMDIELDVFGLNAQDLLRLGGATAGAYLWSQNMLPTVAEPLMYAGAALVAKSVTKRARSMMGTPARARAFGTPMARAKVRSQAALPSGDRSGEGMADQSGYPQFSGLRLNGKVAR
ncbi:MAG: hypothetical protein Q8R28_22570, partial [Dehalococcoidia bacterium]|nr:hypothetical protein [Dehalococcoidia bacterium]